QEVWEKHRKQLLELSWAALQRPSARIDEGEQGLVRHMVKALSVLPTDASIAFPSGEHLYGEPRAIAWALAGLAGERPCERAPDAHWWQILFAEASSYRKQETSLKEFLECTEGTDDKIERELAARILAERDAEVDSLLARDTYTRLGILVDEAQRPQVLVCLTDSLERNRADACRAVDRLFPNKPEVVTPVLQRMSRTDPADSVKRIAA